MIDPTRLPTDLPEPSDDGNADHLPGTRLPAIDLRATDGSSVRLDRLGGDRAVVFAYPWTGRPGEPLLVAEWDSIPGARGCTPETCGFRDLHAQFVKRRVEVFGLSTQDTAYQQELVERLRLPFPVLSDERLVLTRALHLPTFEAAGQKLIKRLTLVVADATVCHVFYPIFPPDRHADEVLRWLDANPHDR
jgi:peroxiredoxin